MTKAALPHGGLEAEYGRSQGQGIVPKDTAPVTYFSRKTPPATLPLKIVFWELLGTKFSTHRLVEGISYLNHYRGIKACHYQNIVQSQRKGARAKQRNGKTVCKKINKMSYRMGEKSSSAILLKRDQ
jgi:hypothetical protein